MCVCMCVCVYMCVSLYRVCACVADKRLFELLFQYEFVMVCVCAWVCVCVYVCVCVRV